MASVTDRHEGGRPVEPLADSAPLAWGLAPQLCEGDPASRSSCVWYHRVWQYLRLLKVTTTIQTNTDFLLSTFEACASDHPRVLICGTADYGMLAHVMHAYGARQADVTVLDRCPTPLALNRWYGERIGRPVTTVRGDALTYTSDTPFDLICTHNFIGRFDDEGRRQLVARWHALLRPGGVVVTTQRVRPGAQDLKSFYTPERARHLGARVVEAARAYPGGINVDIETLRQAVVEHALRLGSFVIRNPQDVADLFKQEGFHVERADEGGGIAERERDRPSDTRAGTDTYRMRLVARKC